MVPEDDQQEGLFWKITADMHVSLRRAILGAKDTAEWKASAPIALQRTVKQAFEETCSAWKDRLDEKLYRGAQGILTNLPQIVRRSSGNVREVAH